ncbi:aldehyde dehydrogenase [Hysterangium stoloniferum]|nr:aldehyde dehydrogenase [Hysterangium stoloniferum]
MRFKIPYIPIRNKYSPFIGGKFINAGPDAQFISVHNPADGQKITEVLTACPSDVADAIHIAQKAFEEGLWSKASTQHRSLTLSRLARLLESRVDEIASLESLQTGRAIREMKAQLRRLPEWDYYAALLRTHTAFVAPTQGKLLNYVNRVPLGVVAQITPFNHPLLIAVKKIAPALAMGNSVLLKPSEMAPLSVLEFAQMAFDAGVPSGVLQVLTGDGPTTGMDIVSDPRVKKVDITAGTNTGREIGRIVGANLGNYTAELGGKAPVVIFNDADLQSAINGTPNKIPRSSAFAAFIASGQTCVSGTRLIVQSKVYETFMAGFLTKTQKITRRIGNPLNPLSSMGTVISARALSRIQAMVTNRSSGITLLGGERMTGLSSLDEHDLSQGYFYPPTVIEDVSVDDDVWQEEIFGPVVVVKRFEEESDGVQLANASRYALGASLWTKNLSRAHRVANEIEAGVVWINSHHRNDPSSPWGGMKESGIGRENGVEAFERYSQSKSIIVNYATENEIHEKEDWFAEDSNERKRYG